MMDDVIYKVLWVDDQEEIVDSTKLDADSFGIELDHYSNWQEAEVALRNNFEDYTAIILDAFCKVKPNEDMKDVFISAVLPSLTLICGEKNRFIPWYILSAGTMKDFSRTVEGARYEHERHHTKEWGQMLYLKDVPDDDPKSSRILYENIRKVGKALTNNIVLFRYKDVFSGLDNIGVRQFVEPILMGILLPLHYPTKYPNFNPVLHYTQLREILEYLFRACNTVGIVPKQCIQNGNVNLNQSSMYLAGKDAEKVGVRYGEKGERIVPDYIEGIIRSILEFGNIHSHSVELDEKDLQKIESIFRTAKSRYIIFGLALQICEVIIWFSEYISKHSDKEINLLLCNELLPKDSAKEDDEGTKKYFNQEFVPEKDEEGIWHCGECYVKITSWESGKMKLININPNTDKRTNAKYPYFARYKKI